MQRHKNATSQKCNVTKIQRHKKATSQKGNVTKRQHHKNATSQKGKVTKKQHHKKAMSQKYNIAKMQHQKNAPSQMQRYKSNVTNATPTVMPIAFPNVIMSLQSKSKQLNRIKLHLKSDSKKTY